MYRICLLLLVLATLPSPASAGGGVVMEGDKCTMHIDFYSARFTAYQPETQGNQEFCEDLPDTGLTLFVLDYLHPSLKEVPVDFRIIRNTTDQGRFAVWDDVAKLGDLRPLTVFYQAPTVEGDASLQLEYEFTEPGEYIGIVTAGHPSNDNTYRSVFPFEVGRPRYQAALLALAIIGVLALYGWRRQAGRKQAMGEAA
ncbi:MAG TPA: hypothetical protein VFG52_03985 [Xanthomonadales bacterium]|nr:hypothetical protein [Xanthomonadales bacterium]